MFDYVQRCPYAAPPELEALRASVFAECFAAEWVDVGLHSWRGNSTERCYESRNKYEQRYNSIGIAVREARRARPGEFDDARAEASFLRFYQHFLCPEFEFE